MSNSTVVASIDAETLLGDDSPQGDPLEMAGVRSLWDFSPTWAFDELMAIVEPHLDVHLRALMRMESAPTVTHAAASRLLSSAPALGYLVVLSHEQFGAFQQAISTALSEANFAEHIGSVDDLDELSHVRPSGDFVAVIA